MKTSAVPVISPSVIEAYREYLLYQETAGKGFANSKLIGKDISGSPELSSLAKFTSDNDIAWFGRLIDTRRPEIDQAVTIAILEHSFEAFISVIGTYSLLQSPIETFMVNICTKIEIQPNVLLKHLLLFTGFDVQQIHQLPQHIPNSILTYRLGNETHTWKLDPLRTDNAIENLCINWADFLIKCNWNDCLIAMIGLLMIGSKATSPKTAVWLKRCNAAEHSPQSIEEHIKHLYLARSLQAE